MRTLITRMPGLDHVSATVQAVRGHLVVRKRGQTPHASPHDLSGGVRSALGIPVTRNVSRLRQRAVQRRLMHSGILFGGVLAASLALDIHDEPSSVLRLDTKGLTLMKRGRLGLTSGMRIGTVIGSTFTITIRLIRMRRVSHVRTNLLSGDACGLSTVMSVCYLVNAVPVDQDQRRYFSRVLVITLQRPKNPKITAAVPGVVDVLGVNQLGMEGQAVDIGVIIVRICCSVEGQMCGGPADALAIRVCGFLTVVLRVAVEAWVTLTDLIPGQWPTLGVEAV